MKIISPRTIIFSILAITFLLILNINKENTPKLESPSGTNHYDPSVNTVISTKPREAVYEYTILEGDSLESVAEKFALKPQSIIWASNLKTGKITPGQTLQIPPIDGVMVIAKVGDSARSLAKQYMTSPENIVNWPFNQFEEETDILKPGSTVMIPEGILPN